MPNQDAVLPVVKKDEPELNLLLREDLNPPLWQSLITNVRDKLFPKKLPPLQLTSRPMKVADIWGEYNYKKKSAGVSLVVHAAALAGLIMALDCRRQGGHQANAADHSGGAGHQ